MQSFISRAAWGRVVLGVLLGAVLVAAPNAAAVLDELEEATVRTARVQGGATWTDQELIDYALSRGTTEIMRFWAGQPLERLIVKLGEPYKACPGFTSMNRVEAEKAVKSGAAVVKKNGRDTVTKDLQSGLQVEWTFPSVVGKEPFETRVSLDGQTLYTEKRIEQSVRKDGSVRPAYLRIDTEEGETLIQVFEYDSPPPTDREDPYGGFNPGDLEPTLVETSETDPAKAVMSNGVRFTAMHGFIFEWDSGFWPGGGSRPGSFPLQVRIFFGAAWARGAEINGELFIDSLTRTIAPGRASGNWWVDYGAELQIDAAINIPFIPSIVIDVDELITRNVSWLPTLDFRYQRNVTFDSFLLDQGSSISEFSRRYRLFDFDIVDALLGLVGISLPSFIPLSAGIRVDGAIEGRGTLEVNAIELSTGTYLTREWEARPVNIVGNSYSAVAELDAAVALEVILHAYPELYAEILFMRFDLPLGDLRLPIPIGKVDMDFASANVQFNNIPVDPTGGGGNDPEGEVGGGNTGGGNTGGGPEGEENNPEQNGGGTGGGSGGGTPTGTITCKTYDYDAGPAVITDNNQTILEVNVPDSGVVNDLSVWVDIYHAKISDLFGSLVGPDGTEVFLFSRGGGSTAHMLDTRFWDSAEESIQAGSGPYRGVYKPVAPLSGFAGKNAKGVWKLKIYDAGAFNRGVAFDWSLTVNPCGINPSNGGGSSTEGETSGGTDDGVHSLDYNPSDGVIGLSELLRAVQLYNSGMFTCSSGSEDGFRPGGGGESCGGHDLDYSPKNWSIGLNELLRAIQFFNSGGYYSAAGGEDGYMPGKKSN